MWVIRFVHLLTGSFGAGGRAAPSDVGLEGIKLEEQSGFFAGLSTSIDPAGWEVPG